MNELAYTAELWLRSLADHVWQSTIVALGAALLVVAFRRYRAEVRAAIWLVASLKFLIPFIAVAAAGHLVPWPEARTVAPPAAIAAVQVIAQPFAPLSWETSERASTAVSGAGASATPILIIGLWTAGSAWLLGAFVIRVRRSRFAIRDAHLLAEGREVESLRRVALRTLPLWSAPGRVSPCVVGIWRPRLIWPQGLSDRLTDTQLDAVMAHELCHVRRHDNLAAAGVTIVQALFWFHPLVWWLGARWSHERERACDEHVLAQGDDPELYADGVLKVGEFCVGGTVLEHAGIAGSSLMERMEAIMNQPTPRALGYGSRAALALAVAVLVSASLMLGSRTLAAQPPDLQAPALSSIGSSSRQGQPAGISGVVIDPSGGFVPGAKVLITAVGNTSPERSLVSDATGRFSTGDLAAGEYDVNVQLPGFRTMETRSKVTETAGSVVRVELAIGSVAEQVSIKGAATPEPPPAAAEGEWQEKLNREPGNATLYFDLAKIYYQHERFVEAETLITQGTAILSRKVTDQPIAGARAGQVGGSLSAPKKLRDVRPLYPSTARAGNVSGTVVLEGQIGRDGTVKNLKVLRSVPELDRSAMIAARQWLFTPTLLNGLPIDVGMTITMNFEAPR